MSDLSVMTARAFDPNGPVARRLERQGRGYAFNAQQVAYALAVADTFQNGRSAAPPVALLEAETGTGKTLGYLVPLLLAASRGSRGLVSTFTIQLLRQVLDDQAPLAVEIVHDLTGRRPAVAGLCGLRNYVSASRVAALRAQMSGEGAPSREIAALTALEKWAREESGLLADFVERHGPLPPGVDEAAVGISASSADEDRAPYEKAKAAAEAADVVIVPHALLLMNALHWFSPMGEGDPRPLLGVLDEADALPLAAESLYRTALPLKDLERTVGLLSGAGLDVRHLAAALERAVALMDRLYARHGKDSDVVARVGGAGGVLVLAGAGARHRKAVGEVAADIARLCRLASDRARERRALRTAADELALAAHAADGIARDCKGEAVNGARATAALQWSPVRAYPSFALFPVQPGRLAARLWTPMSDAGEEKTSFFSACVLTSATLDAPGPETAGDMFRAVRTELGVPRDPVCRRYAPTAFGRAKFVLTDPATAAPTEDTDDGIRSHPAWLDHVAGMVAEAYGQGGRVLMLANSFSDTSAIAERVRAKNIDVLEHRRGEKLGSLLPALRADKRGVLLTPAGWEGLDLPGLLSHVVIARLPFPPPDDLRNAVVERHLLSRGFDGAAVRKRMRAVWMVQALRRTRQGFGRGIRRAQDEVTFWIGDPRFPTPRTAALKACDPESRSRTIPSFVYAVPARFREGIRAPFGRARILAGASASPAKKDKARKKQVPPTKTRRARVVRAGENAVGRPS